jgi:hypothetical protein
MHSDDSSVSNVTLALSHSESTRFSLHRMSHILQYARLFHWKNTQKKSHRKKKSRNIYTKHTTLANSVEMCGMPTIPLFF